MGEITEAFLEEAGFGSIESQDLKGSQRLPKMHIIRSRELLGTIPAREL